MSRSRRLAEIAKANETGFSGTQWWLEDTAEKNSPVQPAATPEPVSVAQSHQADAVRSAEAQHQSAHVSSVQVALAEPARAVEAPAASVRLFASAESAPTDASHDATQLVSKMNGLKERFLWLGRRSRTAETA
jgi:hypothetical protein